MVEITTLNWFLSGGKIEKEQPQVNDLNFFRNSFENSVKSLFFSSIRWT